MPSTAELCLQPLELNLKLVDATATAMSPKDYPVVKPEALVPRYFSFIVTIYLTHTHQHSPAS